LEIPVTKNQAYRAMVQFLDERFSRLPSEALGQLLGEMTLLQDGRPADPAIIAEWDRAVEIAFHD
jgi:hypothetical protein